MTRTRLRQLEQIRNSIVYEDYLNMGVGAEAQPGANIETGLDVDSFTAPSTISLAGNRLLSGLNASDTITTTGATNGANNGTFKIVSLSFSGGLTVAIVEEATIVTEASSPATAITKADANKNLRRDLDHIRTQLRLLNQKPNWYDPPQVAPITKYELVTGVSVSAGTDIILSASETFDAGAPYTLKVFLNGQLLLPSVITGVSLTTSHDYSERDGSGYVSTGTGDRISLSFDIIPADLLQLKWTKEQ